MKKLFAFLLFLIFTTMTALSTDNGVLRIAHLCDPQIGFPRENLYLDLDEFKAEIENVNRLNPDLVVIAGDMVNVPDSLHYSLFFDAVSALKAPLVYTPGNHDIYDPVTYSGLKRYRNLFGDDLRVIRIKGRTLISFNTQLFRTSPADEFASHRARLQAAVGQAVDAGGGLIIVSHIPPFVAGIDESEEYFNISLAYRRPLLDFFAANGAFLWLCGHTHKTHRNDYGPVTILNGETTSQNFDKRPKGFRLLTIAPDNTFTWEFIPNK